MFIPKRSRNTAALAESENKYAHIVALLEKPNLRSAYRRFLIEANVVVSFGLLFYYGIAFLLGHWALATAPIILIAFCIWAIRKLNIRVAESKSAEMDGTLHVTYAVHHAAFALLNVGIFSLGLTLKAIYGSGDAIPEQAMWAISVPVLLLMFGYPLVASGGWRQLVMRSGKFYDVTGTATDKYLAYAWSNLTVFIVELLAFFFTFCAGILAMAMVS